MVRNYLGDWTGQFHSISHTDLLKYNQSSRNSLSFRGPLFWSFISRAALASSSEQLQQPFFFKATYGWSDEVKVVNTEIMGCRHCHCVLSHVSLLFPRPLQLPVRTDVPLRDRQPLFVQTQACPVLCFAASAPVCVCLLADLCMPVSGFCVTSRKSQEKQNWTLCKQPVTNFWSVRPTLYLHYQLCSLRISCFQWGRSARIQYCLCGPRQMVYVIAYCVPVPTTARRRKHSCKMFDPKFICCCTYTVLQYGLEHFLCKFYIFCPKIKSWN